MWNLPTALMQRRQMCRRSLVVLTLIGLAASSAAAGDIVITNGYLDRTPYAGPLVIRGDRGFIFVGHPGNGLFQILNDCNAGDAPCGPGDRVSLAAAWSGLDLPGSATLDGVSYPKVGDISSLSAEFSATVTLPPFNSTATVTAPFVFSGRFFYPNGRESLNGSGVVTVSLEPHSLPGRWRVTRVLYEFGDRLPAPWTSEDVGRIGTPGHSSAVASTFTIAGDGGDIWGAADAFRFVFAPMKGAGTITARLITAERPSVASTFTVAAPNPFAKAGIMIRASSDPTAPNVILDVKPGGELELMVRYAAGEQTQYLGGGFTSGAGVWLQLVSSGTGQILAAYSENGLSWTSIAAVNVPLGADAVAGLAVTSHDVAALHAALFDRVTVGNASLNMLERGDFESYDPPILGTPGWVSDDALRQVPAKSETHQPHSGTKNGACWTTESLDCGMYQEIVAAASGTYVFRVYATADRGGGLVGVNVNGVTASLEEVAVRPFGDYALYTVSFAAAAKDIIRVWMYSPPSPGYVVIDDATLMRSSGPRVVTSGEWRIGSAGGAFGTFTLNGANFALTGTYDSGDAEPVTGCGGGCRTPVTLGLHTAFFNDIPGTIETFAPGTAVIDGHAYTPFVEYTGSLILDGGVVTIAAPMSTDYPVLVSASTPFTMSGALAGYNVSFVRDPQLQFEIDLTGKGTATLEMLAGPGPDGTATVMFFRLRYVFEPDDASE